MEKFPGICKPTDNPKEISRKDHVIANQIVATEDAILERGCYISGINIWSAQNHR